MNFEPGHEFTCTQRATKDTHTVMCAADGKTKVSFYLLVDGELTSWQVLHQGTKLCLG